MRFGASAWLPKKPTTNLVSCTEFSVCFSGSAQCVGPSRYAENSQDGIADDDVVRGKPS